MGISVKQFKDILKERTQKICEEEGKNWDISANRGYAFQLWVADLISNFESNFETDIDEAVLGSNDLNADIVLEDTINKQLLICQCKFSALSKLKPIDEDEVVSFFNRHELYMNRKWVEENGSQDAIMLLADYSEKVNDGYKVIFRFISTGESSERINDIPKTVAISYQNSSFDLTFELYDFSKLKEYYVRSQKIEESIPQRVEIPLKEGKYIEKDEPKKTVIAILSGSILKQLYNQYKDSLYAYNIRNYLGNRGINSNIQKTANERPELFFYLNNGVSAICTNLEVSNGQIIAENFQIINGAQTVGSLGRSPSNKELEVLFRVTVAESVKTDKGFNQEIIQCNNSQNTIKLSDFRSNDHIHHWLEKKFKEVKPSEVIPNIVYSRKRSYKRTRGATTLKLEEFAKIRYSYLYEPTKCLSQPKALWTLKDDGGVYEKSFGVSDEIINEWSDNDFYESVLAIAIFLRYTKNAKEQGKIDSAFKFLNRLKWHALSLANIFITSIYPDEKAKSIYTKKRNFEKFWKQYWDIAYDILDDSYTAAIEDEDVSTFSFVRSTEKWERMKNKFKRKLSVKYSTKPSLD